MNDKPRSVFFLGVVGLTGIMAVFMVISFFSPYWLQFEPSSRLPRSKFSNLGLWHACFDGFHDRGHQYEVKFYGCKHILLEEYDIIRTELSKPFFVAVQFFYTLSFVGMLLTICMIVMFMLCIDDYFRVKMLVWIGIVLNVSAAMGTIALIVFGAYGDSRDFMPEWEHNFLSWAYALAVTSVLLMYICGVLFMVEARIIRRREMSKDTQFHMNRDF